MTKSRGIRARQGSRRKWVEENQGKLLCACGCGQPLTLRDEHFNTRPRFVWGHNAKAKPPRARAAPIAPHPCECGCGELLATAARFSAGHHLRGRPVSAATRAKIAAKQRGRKTGRRPPNYNGGRQAQGDGYVQFVVAGHPFSDARGRVMEHRVVLERHLRIVDPQSVALVDVDGELFLRPDFHVHHIDGVKDHNVAGNLEAMTIAEHSALHNRQRGAA